MSTIDFAQQIAHLDPLCYSTEGLDDCCHFCGSDDLHCTFKPDYQRWATHHPDCVWVLARRHLGQPIEPHTVRAIDASVSHVRQAHPQHPLPLLSASQGQGTQQDPGVVPRRLGTQEQTDPSSLDR